jgi:hypothetical protein
MASIIRKKASSQKTRRMSQPSKRARKSAGTEVPRTKKASSKKTRRVAQPSRLERTSTGTKGIRAKKASSKKTRRVAQASRPARKSAGMEDVSGGRKFFDSMVETERSNTEEWFSEYRDLLLDASAAVDDAVGDAHPDDKEELRGLKNEIEGKLAKLSQEREAFFNENILALRPPSPEIISRTKELSAEMEDLIRTQKRAQAIVRLAGELANLAARVGVSP